MIVRKGPGLLGTMARTVVIAGTATAVSGGIMRRHQAQLEQAARAAAYEQQQQQYRSARQHAPAVRPEPVLDVAGQLRLLADLWAGGAITDAEFTAAKAKILA
jgi:hypothetical protein